MTDNHAFLNHLRALPVFRGLSEAALAQLAGGAAWREFRAKQVIFLEGETSSGLHYLASGCVKAVKQSLEGREHILRVINPGEMFNDIGAFTDRPNPATAIALEDSGIWVLPRSAIAQTLRQQPEMAQHIIENMAESLVQLVNLVADLSFRSVASRLARLLMDEAEGDVIRRPRWQTQAELAAQLGTVPDVLQRAIRALQADGAIEVTRAEIRILNRPALRAWCE
ncbi:MAG TPA: Crp/Fnr family transcriptional regulator [Thermoflexales bacterium]|nr:Crp/Fnr family transcriptional regulator [Thermoflexales bacterium]HQW35694.1 Crp/Fnr family transcriptional regulator [Thermoflexales bacterium]